MDLTDLVLFRVASARGANSAAVFFFFGFELEDDIFFAGLTGLKVN